MIIYHVQWWSEQTSEHDCYHCAIVDVGFYLHYADAVKAASQYPKDQITISHIPVIEHL